MSRLICLECHAIIWVGIFEDLNGSPGDLWHIPGSLQLDRSGEVLDDQALTSDMAGSNQIHKLALLLSQLVYMEVREQPKASHMSKIKVEC